MTNKNIEAFILDAVKRGSSDIHISVGQPPIARVQGRLVKGDDFGVIDKDQVSEFILSLMTPVQREEYLSSLEIDFSVIVAGQARFRANAYHQQGLPAISMRHITDAVPKIDDLKLPPICHAIAKLKQGFVLVTGPTGSGKTSTCASIIDEINETRTDHVVTIEDPIEYVHVSKNAIISQRELDTDTKSWPAALKSVLRQDPNVVYIGEMRDPATMGAAMTVSETGHLVLATLHTNSAGQTIERIVDSFPENQQSQIVMQLSLTLEAILSQRLIPSKDGKRVVATEILVVTPAVRNTIREAKSFQIDNIIQTSGNVGMRLL
jgi:twitching motility protein PilT